MQNNKEGDFKRLRAAVYLRVSTDEQVQGNWLDIQKDYVKNFINSRFDYENFSEDRIYVDEWVSWTLAIKDRPWLKRLFEDIMYSKDGKPPFDIVVVYKIDRFARSLYVLLEIIEALKYYWISFASTQEMIDTSTPFGKAMLWILWVFAELDREMIIQKMHAWIDKSLKKGVVYKPRFGYKKNKEKKLIPYREQAEIVKEIFYMFIEKQYPISKICKYLTDSKVPIPTAWDTDKLSKRAVLSIYKWSDKTVRKILADEIYIGKYYYNKEKTDKEAYTKNKIRTYLPKEEWTLSPVWHEPIIDPLTFKKAQALLDEKVWNFQKSTDYLLWWLLKCDYCRDDRIRWMISWTGISSNWGQYYQCWWKTTKKYTNICCTIPIPKWEIEGIIKEQIKEIINNPKAIEKHMDTKSWCHEIQKNIKKDIVKLNKKKETLLENYENIKELFAAWKMNQTAEEYVYTLNEIQENINLTNQKISELEMKLSQSVETEKQIKALDYLSQIIGDLDKIFSDDEKCRELINVLVDNIVIFSEVDENIKVTWRKKVWWIKQAIPKWVVINFKLPQEYLNDVIMTTPTRNGNSNDLRKDIEEQRKIYSSNK